MYHCLASTLFYNFLRAKACSRTLTGFSKALKVKEEEVPLYNSKAAYFQNFMKNHVQGTKQENGHIAA